jgi:hypothetical protein
MIEPRIKPINSPQFLVILQRVGYSCFPQQVHAFDAREGVVDPEKVVELSRTVSVDKLLVVGREGGSERAFDVLPLVRFAGVHR